MYDKVFHGLESVPDGLRALAGRESWGKVVRWVFSFSSFLRRKVLDTVIFSNVWDAHSYNRWSGCARVRPRKVKSGQSCSLTTVRVWVRALVILSYLRVVRNMLSLGWGVIQATCSFSLVESFEADPWYPDLRETNSPCNKL